MLLAIFIVVTLGSVNNHLVEAIDIVKSKVDVQDFLRSLLVVFNCPQQAQEELPLAGAVQS